MALAAYMLTFSASVCLGTSIVVASTQHSRMDAFPNSTKAEPRIIYEDFLRTFRPGTSLAEGDDTSRAEREALFHARHQEVEKHNARPGVFWVAAINHFADYTQTERLALLGHKPGLRMPNPVVKGLGRIGNPASPKLLQLEKHALASRADWRRLKSSKYVRDQGPCGSCWAVAAAGTIEMRFELENNGKTRHLSHSQLVDCVPNPKRCGGSGGCDGATAELAFDFVKDHGITFASEYEPGACKASDPDAQVNVGGYMRLPENEDAPLMEALSKSGPVVGSVDATNWFSYDSGIFDDCPKNAVVNHAIIIMGYGHDDLLNADFWLIRNSWGARWGEMGYIRLLRHSDSNSWCGIDYRPEEGNGCVGGPSQLPVCGMCGILSDSSYPVAVSDLYASKKPKEVANHVEQQPNLFSMQYPRQ